MNEIQVVAGILIHDGHILCMRRGKTKFDYLSYKYEFPGGKAEPGETLPQALHRELEEELGLSLPVAEENHFLSLRHTYPDFTVSLHTYIIPVSSREFTLTEHQSFQWVPKGESLFALDWVAADETIIQALAASTI